MFATVFKACFRLGILLSAGGVIAGFFHLPDVIFAFILLGLVAVYLSVSVWTANRPSGYNEYRACFADIMGDLTAYSLLLLFIFAWLLARCFLTIPVSDVHYWLIALFLLAMCLITLFEMVVTVRSCLIALERQNPISIVR